MATETTLKTRNEIKWERVGTFDSFGEKGRFLFKSGEKQIAIFKTPKGILAVNNRCPHEGYPLIEGTLKKGCILACNWHGWAFDLESGETLQGRDPVKSYKVRVQGEEVWLDLSAEPKEALIKRAYAEFDEAMEEHDYDRIARSLCRLDKVGEPLENTVIGVVNASASRLERGVGHTHAGLADWLSLAADVPEQKITALLEALGHFSWDFQFSPMSPISGEIQAWSSEALSEAVEAMDQASSLALVRGAFRSGKSFADIKPTLQNIAFRHFAGFGHPAIYLMKMEELIQRLGKPVEESLSLMFVRYMCLSAREDLIPEFRQWAHFMNAQAEGQSAPTADQWSGMASNQAMEAVVRSLDRPEGVWQAVTTALALNMARFNLGLEQGVQQSIRQNVNWLDFTHGLTFAEAVRYHAKENPTYWRSGLLQMACLLGRNVKFLAETRWQDYLPDESPQNYFESQQKAMFNMDHGDYIFAVHRLKTLRACKKLHQLVGKDNAPIILASLNRYLSSPLRMRHPARTVWQAQQTVLREG